ncbi:hypothetical protein EV424DRAFT_1577580 [Suillus variegatus]|nr:hypothetical protein EV424DRAFT_1577580 [Suillus variegatus]
MKLHSPPPKRKSMVHKYYSDGGQSIRWLTDEEFEPYDELSANEESSPVVKAVGGPLSCGLADRRRMSLSRRWALRHFQKVRDAADLNDSDGPVSMLKEVYRSAMDICCTVFLEGFGKTSLIHSLAGELGLDIYVVSLSSKGMSDNTLTTLMGHVPSRYILLLEDLDATFTRSVSHDASSTGAPTASNTNSTTTETSDGSTLSLSGLLNSLDGVATAEGRLLFATTNHIERLDPALTKGIFKCFFPSKPAGVATTSPPEEDVDTSQKNLPLPKHKARSHTIPVLDETEISELAKRFADAIPENELSISYLLKNKVRPRECVDEVAQIIEERETREKLKKEKAEREVKEKKETEEKECKEKEEKVAKEQEEKDAKEKTERKERAKTKKAHRAETALKLEGTSSTSSLATTETVVVLSTAESSSSESDSSNGGIEADT